MMGVEQEFIVTFGAGQTHAGCFIRVEAESRDEARGRMVFNFGTEWAFIYGSEEEAGVDRWKLREIPWPEEREFIGTFGKGHKHVGCFTRVKAPLFTSALIEMHRVFGSWTYWIYADEIQAGVEAFGLKEIAWPEK